MEHTSISWSNQLEELIGSEGEKCRGLCWIHSKAELAYNRKNNYIAIPVIVLSTLAGTASVGSSSLFPDDTKIGSIVIGLVSISVGILNTISSYFSYSRKAESHRIASISYAKLFNQIAVELSLPRKERVSPNELLQSLRDSMERLAETTPTPPTDILEQFNNRFKDEDKSISRPIETNGLHKIKIYRDSIEYASSNSRQEQSPNGRKDGIREGRSGSSSSENLSRVSLNVRSGGESKGKDDSSADGVFTSANPLLKPISEPV